MRKRFIAVACTFALLVGAGACKKKEEHPVPQTGIPGQQMPAGQPGMPPGMPAQPGRIVMPKGEMRVVVPDSVKGKWKAVVLQVEDKTTSKVSDYTVNLHSDFKVPNSSLKVKVGDFLPDFRMNGLQMTSTSNDPNNPAVGVKIFDGSKEVFPAPGKKWGWLYGRPEFRSMHPFEHPQFHITLKNWVKNG